MAPYQQRVVVEKQELDDRIAKLDAFIKGNLFEILHVQERERLIRQLVLMVKLSAVLDERIVYFPKA